MRKLGFGVAALLATALCAPVNATKTLTAEQYQKATVAIRVMQSINLLTFGDATLQSDVEGKVFVGGNLYGNSSSIDIGGAKSVVATTTTKNGKTTTTYSNNGGYRNDDKYRALTVGGSMLSGVNVNNGIGMSSISIAVGGNAKNLVVNNGGGTKSYTTTAGKTVSVAVAATNATALIGGNFDQSGFNPGKSGTVTKTATYGGTLTNSQTQDKAYVKQDKTLKAGGTADAKAGIAKVTQTYQDDMLTLSAILGALTPNAALVSTDKNNIHFTFTADALNGDYAVADITASQLASGTFFLPNYATSTNGKTLVINVSGSSFTFGANEVNGSYANLASLVQQNIIWNFMDATTVNVNTAVYGTILAPKATVTGNSPINGSVVAKVFQDCGEVHLGTFNGNTGFLLAPPPSNGGGNPTPGVPEPSSWMTMLMGFGFLGSVLRYQRRKERLAAA